MNSSRATNILLAIIAVALIAIALKPADLMPTAAAQVERYDDTRADARERFTSITATDKAVQQQVEATREIATSIGRLADSGENIAKAIQDVSRSLTNLGDRIAESSAARPRTP